MKQAMVNAYEAGVFNVLPLHLTVHDELDNSIPPSTAGAEAWRELGNIMTNAISLQVPVVVDAETGPNWGQLKKVS
jgi:DNA polymerase I-like protein with 3'-5' exonuclease and polymerase domains